MSSLFVPYPFRPFWQPNTRPFSGSPPAPHQDVTELSQKLDTAEKKILEYAQLIASLYAEMKGYQSIVCRTCRENVLRANLTTACPPGFTYSSSQSIITALPSPSDPSRNDIVGPADPTEITHTTSGVQVTAEPSFHFGSSQDIHDQSPVHSPGPSGDPDPNSLTTSSSQLTVARPATADVSDSELPIPSTPENPTIADPASDWLVEYNPEVKQTLNLHVANTFTYAANVLCTHFSRDGKYLAVGLSNGETHVYNMTTESTIVLAKRSTSVFYTEAVKAPSQIWAVKISPDNKILVTGDNKGQINLWEIARRRLRTSFKQKGLVRSLDFSPDGRFLVSKPFDKSSCVWRIRDGSLRTSCRESFSFMSGTFSPDRRYVVAANNQRSLCVWVARTGRLVASGEVGDTNLKTVVFTADGKGIAGGTRTLHFWDVSWLVDNRSACHRIKDDCTRQVNKIWEFDGHKGNITAVSFSPDGRWVISGSLDHNICILDARCGDLLCTLKGHGNLVWGVNFSPTGHYIASGGNDRRVRHWRYDEVE